MKNFNAAEQKLAEAKELLVLSDKYYEEGNSKKAKEYLYLASNASQSAFAIAAENIKTLSNQIDLMKIILDDDRPFPSNPEYSCARTYHECISLLSNASTINYISLDYDLDEEETGLSVLQYIKAKEINIDHINIHSTHPVGIVLMKEYAERHFPSAELTFNFL